MKLKTTFWLPSKQYRIRTAYPTPHYAVGPTLAQAASISMHLRSMLLIVQRDLCLWLALTISPIWRPLLHRSTQTPHLRPLLSWGNILFPSTSVYETCNTPPLTGMHHLSGHLSSESTNMLSMKRKTFKVLWEMRMQCDRF